ncbi:endoplasmic reticulum metallopeptidase 1-like [Wyeomyia smithii]|uniref:endoplasmic reticulum metallopeptidase 1-like n=1 Tax=Wyeomyia smithii TaxID=174621 RepID=UPI0024680A2B|nr:endoplasmic reticulum metallopeptidase 1-like [Wyeomyia smithii]XP_055540799.1 endoplasmic reticulum metallopeptidase 1-like [Wyeomyia smithii]XP_055540808.1 endoplasmic reticulum metallopeptidase 1-like [Wyeomyia smithii]XP_055540816.1 endoplasmic reticulum metallopeptidase 1-like [Wyeomyia smithii]XP_055540826.1 endoplasmic reticulum metallopeptidase 1-like [Wyeomyia smithii]
MVDHRRGRKRLPKTEHYEALGGDEKNLHKIDSQLGMFGVVLMLFCGTISSYLISNLPAALTRADLERYPGAFIAERAWENLKVLNDFGPKPTGSETNEKTTADYLKQQIALIEASKHKNQKLLIEHQIVSGGYAITFRKNPLTSLYRNVQNLVVMLEGENQNTTSPALMLNCHFDTVASSPGASDDAASCCVMLEIIRILSRQPTRNRHSIIFLFNGAEETPLQAAHGFITQHPWAKQVAAFLNLESAGSGGKEVLFQSGPQHPWMIDVYARAIRHPYANAAGEEIFQSGLIPSDTDFRIFRDFGHVPGMDFAHWVEGYRYHTKYDNIDYLSMSVIQRTGDNILSITREMANSDELANSRNGRVSEGYSVFYDFLGLLFVKYSTDTAVTINTLVAILSILLPYFAVSKSLKNAGEVAILKEIMYGFIALIAGTLFSVLVCLIIGRQLDAMGRAMTWYSTPYLVLGLYCCPALLSHCFGQVIVNMFFSDKKNLLNLSQIVQSRLIGVNLFWAIIVISLTFTGIRSSYIFMVIQLMSVMSVLITSLLGYQNSCRKWLLVHVAFQIITMLWATQFYHQCMKLFIPISGRVGGAQNPEYLVGSIAALSILLTGSYMFPLVALLKKSSELISRLTVFVLVGLLIACFTQVGFPYRDDSTNAPSVQRHYVTHTLRLYHDQTGTLRKKDSGFLFREMDRNSYRLIQGVVAPESVTPMSQMNTCETEIFCAVPFYSIWHQIRFDNFWLPGPEPVVNKMVTLKLQDTEQITDHIRRLHFTLEGSTLSSLIIGPKPGVKLVSWSLLEEVTPSMEFNNRDGHFVLITYGLPDDGPWNVTMDFEHQERDYAEPLVDLAVVTTFWEFHRNHTEELNDLIRKFPSWAHVIPAVAAMNIYLF